MANTKNRYTPDKIIESEIIRKKDVFGTEEEYISIEDTLFLVKRIKSGFTPDPRKNLPKVKDMVCNEDDVFICAYAKAGTHWVWEIASMLASGKTEYMLKPKESAMMEFHYPEIFESVPSPRIINTHYPFRLLPNMLKKGKGKILFLQRNPKDVLVSAYHQSKNSTRSPFRGDFNDFFRSFIHYNHNDWFRYTCDWEETIKATPELSVHMLFYEDLKKDPVEEITKLSKFMGINSSEDFIRNIAEMCAFGNMRKANVEVKDLSEYEQEAKIMANMYRKGEVGDWRNWFTVAQNEEFDALYEQKMAGCTFKFTYSI